MLTIKERQNYLKYLGYYAGALDGVAGPLTQAAYKALQDDYFTRKADRDGKYGKNTDLLLRNAYNVKKYTDDFALAEFRCGCNGKYCTGYPAELDPQLLVNLQKIRDSYGATKVTSGLRCKRHNASLTGSSVTSCHLEGKAVDLRNATTKTTAGRQALMAKWRSLCGGYTYCNVNGSHPNMGRAVHVQVE